MQRKDRQKQKPHFRVLLKRTKPLEQGSTRCKACTPLWPHGRFGPESPELCIGSDAIAHVEGISPPIQRVKQHVQVRQRGSFRLGERRRPPLRERHLAASLSEVIEYRSKMSTAALSHRRDNNDRTSDRMENPVSSLFPTVAILVVG